jgi:hypothetical protein
MEGRIVQVIIIGGIVAVIIGSLLCEFYIGPRYRQWRVRRRHRHAAELLTVYRILRAKRRARRLAEAMSVIREVVGEDAPVLVGPGGRVTILCGRAVLSHEWSN